MKTLLAMCLKSVSSISIKESRRNTQTFKQWELQVHSSKVPTTKQAGSWHAKRTSTLLMSTITSILDGISILKTTTTNTIEKVRKCILANGLHVAINSKMHLPKHSTSQTLSVMLMQLLCRAMHLCLPSMDTHNGIQTSSTSTTPV